MNLVHGLVEVAKLAATAEEADLILEEIAAVLGLVLLMLKTGQLRIDLDSLNELRSIPTRLVLRLLTLHQRVHVVESKIGEASCLTQKRLRQSLRRTWLSERLKDVSSTGIRHAIFECISLREKYRRPFVVKTITD